MKHIRQFCDSCRRRWGLYGFEDPDPRCAFCGSHKVRVWER